ncbi:hypothetical protein TSOC_013739 [Tetrabaena socialis]|uniref:Protein kinase domain-containing protein n=1 Tax=Tetrabaena socialis TaxID=47790 RepID=A0A2J7ZJJ7_9CHLO|nr:hypothetical protein TSOC_013739 [Tetrabaena socialis]|eukprot:PNH00438.1 hypothetical protein TSOC_013739 [Tetrabaena socialis]
MLMPAARYPVVLRRTGTMSIQSLEPPSVQTWNAFPCDAAAWVSSMAPQLAGMPAPPQVLMDLNRTWTVYMEDQLYPLLEFTVLAAVAALLARLELQVAFRRTSAADYVGFSPADGAIRLVVEVKHAFALPMGSKVLQYDQLRDARGKDNGRTADERHVEQLYGYMWKEGVEYGLLCSDVAYWPAKLEGSGSGPDFKPVLLLAPPVLCDGLQPTVIGALSYLCYLALQGPSPGLRPMGGQPAGSPAGGSGLAAPERTQRPKQSRGTQAAVQARTLRTLLNRVGDPFAFIATELVEGGVPLCEALDAPGFSPVGLRQVAASALAGVRAMHDLGVAHGDISGSNCMVTAAGRVVWVDLAAGVLGASAGNLQRELAEAEGLVRGRLHLSGSEEGAEGAAATAERRGWCFGELELATRATAACLMSDEGPSKGSQQGEHDGRDVRAAASAWRHQPQRLPPGVAVSRRLIAPIGSTRVPRTVPVAAPGAAAWRGVLRPVMCPR